MKKNLTIESMAYQGAGVAHSEDGKTVFVEGALVGDVIEPLECLSQPNYDKCKRFELVEPSAYRVQARCPYGKDCGGCPWQELAYAEQLKWKRQFVVDALTRIGKVARAEELVGECVASPEQWHYRNKIELSSFMQNGKLGLGLKKKESHEHVRLDECLLLPKKLTGMPKNLAGALNYSMRDSADKLMRVAVRSSVNTGSTEVGLFMRPSGVQRGLVAKTLAASSEFTSLTRVIFTGEMAERKVKQVEVLSGAGYWQEQLAGNGYKISAPSFFQINSFIAEAMINKCKDIVESLELDSSAHVADLYSGAGTFTLPLARWFDNVSAIESYGSSIRDLRRNLEEQQLYAEVIGGDVARELAALNPAQFAVIDPPRSGLRPEAVQALLEYKVPNLMYVSCNPSTMARDIGLLVQGGYELKEATPFDQFPQSYHVECVALLSKRS